MTGDIPSSCRGSQLFASSRSLKITGLISRDRCVFKVRPIGGSSGYSVRASAVSGSAWHSDESRAAG